MEMITVIRDVYQENNHLISGRKDMNVNLFLEIVFFLHDTGLDSSSPPLASCNTFAPRPALLKHFIGGGQKTEVWR